MTGFYAFLNGKDWFMETDKQNVTNALVLDFCNKIQNYRNSFTNITEEDIKYMKGRIEKAEYTEDKGWYTITAKYSCTYAPIDENIVVFREG